LKNDYLNEGLNPIGIAWLKAVTVVYGIDF
jgi:hypothetical protein